MRTSRRQRRSRCRRFVCMCMRVCVRACVRGTGTHPLFFCSPGARATTHQPPSRAHSGLCVTGLFICSHCSQRAPALARSRWRLFFARAFDHGTRKKTKSPQRGGGGGGGGGSGGQWRRWRICHMERMRVRMGAHKRVHMRTLRRTDGEREMGLRIQTPKCAKS